MYNLYFHNLPTLEKRCIAAGIPVEPFLCAGVSHVVVLNKTSICPKLLAKTSTLGVKLISAAAVTKWMSDVAKRHPSPPPAATPKPATPKPAPKPQIQTVQIQRPELIIHDSSMCYKPQYATKISVPFFPDYPCTGSAWARNNAPDPAPGTQRTLARRQKVYCENCRVTVSDLDAHLDTKQHQDFAGNDSNFADLDAVIGELTLDKLLNVKKRRKMVAPLTFPRSWLNNNA